MIDLDGPLTRPLLEATFPSGGGFFAGPRGRLARDGGCGPERPASTDLGPGTVKTPEPSEEGANPQAPEPAPPPDTVHDEDARVCVRVSRSHWIGHRLRGDDVRRLYSGCPASTAP